MIVEYKSKYGRIVKQCPGLPEYYYKGEFIARGSAISGPNPDIPPTQDDWEFCYGLLDKEQQKEIDDRLRGKTK